MNNKKGLHAQTKPLVSIGVLFLLISMVVTRVMPNTRMLPDLALILTIYCSLYLVGKNGVVLPIFAGAYIGSFSAFPIEYMVLYGVLYFAIRFVSSFFQLRFVGYPMFLAFILEVFIGVIHALEIYMKQPGVFSLEIVTKIILLQSMLTVLFLPPIFFVFERFSQSFPSYFRRALK